MKSVKEIVLDGLKYFRQALLSDTPVENDTTHALSLAGAYSLQSQINSLNSSFTTVQSNVKNIISSSDSNIPIILFKNKTFTEFGVQSSDIEGYYKAWWQWIKNEFPDLPASILIGTTHPNSKCFSIGYIYGTSNSEYDTKNGKPRYCCLLSLGFGSIMRTCGYNDGVWYMHSWNHA